MESELFHHDPLDKSRDSIRLCRLLPGRDSEPVHCELIHTSAHSAIGNYSALSYMWGNTPDNYLVWINGRRHYVRTNLWSALHTLRQTSGIRVLWIDALCINQQDVLERNHQVAFMHKIYRDAEKVLVWLGPSTSARDTFGDALYQRQYWRRAWIRQEILAKKTQHIVIHWSSGYETWSDFFEHGRNLSLANGSDVTGGFFSNVTRSPAMNIYWYRAKESSTAPRNLAGVLSNLEKYGESECSDPRDRIFSVIALAADYERLRDLVSNYYSIDRCTLYFVLLGYRTHYKAEDFAALLRRLLELHPQLIAAKWNELIEKEEEPKQSFEWHAIEFVQQMADQLHKMSKVSQYPPALFPLGDSWMEDTERSYEKEGSGEPTNYGSSKSFIFELKLQRSNIFRPDRKLQIRICGNRVKPASNT